MDLACSLRFHVNRFRHVSFITVVFGGNALWTSSELFGLTALTVLAFQESFNKQNEACVHRVTAARVHRYSNMGACFSFTGSVNGGQGSCGGRPHTPRYHKDWSNRLFSGHTRLFNQDNSTVGPLTTADVGKRKDVKQHKQAVSSIFFFLISMFE